MKHGSSFREASKPGPSIRNTSKPGPTARPAPVTRSTSSRLNINKPVEKKSNNIPSSSSSGPKPIKPTTRTGLKPSTGNEKPSSNRKDKKVEKSYPLLPISVGSWIWIPDEQKNSIWRMAKCVDKEGSKITLKSLYMPLLDDVKNENNIENKSSHTSLGNWEDIILEHGPEDDETKQKLNESNLREQNKKSISAQISDVTQLQHLHEPSLLHVLSKRALIQPFPEAYTWMGTVLVSMNPLVWLPEPEPGAYINKPLNPNHPHPFALAEVAFQKLSKNAKKLKQIKNVKLSESKCSSNKQQNKKNNEDDDEDDEEIQINQSIVISGESGAGKTETAKIILRYLTSRVGDHSSSQSSQSKHEQSSIECIPHDDSSSSSSSDSDSNSDSDSDSNNDDDEKKKKLFKKKKQNYTTKMNETSSSSILKKKSSDQLSLDLPPIDSMGTSNNTGQLHEPLNSSNSSSGLEVLLLECNPLLESFGNSVTSRNPNSSRFGKLVRIHFVKSFSLGSDNTHNSKQTPPPLPADTGVVNESAEGDDDEGLRWRIESGSVETYLLEKPRVVSQLPAETNYHAFYELLAGADPELRKSLLLPAPIDKKGNVNMFAASSSAAARRRSITMKNTSTPEGTITETHSCEFPFLNIPKQKNSNDISGFWQGHAEGFAHLQTSLHSLLSFNHENKNNSDNLDPITKAKHVWSLVAGVLHLSRIKFGETETDSGPAAVLHPSSEEELSCELSKRSLEAAAHLFGIKEKALASMLLEREMDLASGESFSIKLKMRESLHARDALAKALYGALFSWIVEKINETLEKPNHLDDGQWEDSKDARGYIGVLDIFGFESFEVNGLEQLLINFANEALQDTFNKKVIDAELELYRNEGIDFHVFGESNHNADTIELLINKTDGVLPSLDTVCRGPRPNELSWVSKLHSTHKDHKSFFKLHPKDRTMNFAISHFAGSVKYSIISNDDEEKGGLKNSSSSSASSSSSSGSWIDKNNDAAPQSAPNVFSETNNQTLAQVGSLFVESMKSLQQALGSTECCFARCLKPNRMMKPGLVDAAFVAHQLRALGLVQTAQVLRVGLPTRVKYGKGGFGSLAVSVKKSLRQAFYDAFGDSKQYEDGSGSSVNSEMNTAYFNQKQESKIINNDENDNNNLDKDGLKTNLGGDAALAAALLWVFDVPKSSYRLGKTRAFFKSGEGSDAVFKMLETKMAEQGDSINEKLESALKAQRRANEAAIRVQRLIHVARAEMSRVEAMERKVEAINDAGIKRSNQMASMRMAADEEIAKGKAVQAESDRISAQIKLLMNGGDGSEDTKDLKKEEEAQYAFKQAAESNEQASKRAAQAVEVAKMRSNELMNKETLLKQKLDGSEAATHRAHEAVYDLKCAADEIINQALNAMVAAKEMRIDDILAAAEVAQDSLKVITERASAVEHEVEGLSLDDNDELDLDATDSANSDKPRPQLSRQTSQLEMAARSTLAAAEVGKAVKEAQDALLEANTAKEAFLRSKEEGEFMARQEAKAAQEAVRLAESALSSARHTAGIVRQKGALGSGRHRSKVESALHVAKTKSGLLWTDLNEVVSNLSELREDMMGAKLGITFHESITVGLKMPTENSLTPGDCPAGGKGGSSELKHRIVLRKLENMYEFIRKVEKKQSNVNEVKIEKGKEQKKPPLYEELTGSDKDQFLQHLDVVMETANDTALNLYKLCLAADTTFASLKDVNSLRESQDSTTESIKLLAIETWNEIDDAAQHVKDAKRLARHAVDLAIDRNLLAAKEKTEETKTKAGIVSKVAQRASNAVFKIDELSKQIEKCDQDAISLCDKAKNEMCNIEEQLADVESRMEKTEEAMELALSILAAHEMAKQRMEAVMNDAKVKAKAKMDASVGLGLSLDVVNLVGGEEGKMFKNNEEETGSLMSFPSESEDEDDDGFGEEIEEPEDEDDDGFGEEIEEPEDEDDDGFGEEIELEDGIEQQAESGNDDGFGEEIDLSVDCLKRHGLVSLTIQSDQLRPDCDGCMESIQGNSYQGCAECDFGLCQACVEDRTALAAINAKKEEEKEEEQKTSTSIRFKHDVQSTMLMDVTPNLTLPVTPAAGQGSKSGGKGGKGGGKGGRGPVKPKIKVGTSSNKSPPGKRIVKPVARGTKDNLSTLPKAGKRRPVSKDIVSKKLKADCSKKHGLLEMIVDETISGVSKLMLLSTMIKLNEGEYKTSQQDDAPKPTDADMLNILLECSSCSKPLKKGDTGMHGCSLCAYVLCNDCYVRDSRRANYRKGTLMDDDDAEVVVGDEPKIMDAAISTLKEFREKRRERSRSRSRSRERAKERKDDKDLLSAVASAAPLELLQGGGKRRSRSLEKQRKMREEGEITTQGRGDSDSDDDAKKKKTRGGRRKLELEMKLKEEKDQDDDEAQKQQVGEEEEEEEEGRYKRWYNLGIEMEDEGRYEEALEAYERAVEANEEFPDAYYNMGLVLESLGDKMLASEAYLTAIFLLNNRKSKEEEDERRKQRKTERRNSLSGLTGIATLNSGEEGDMKDSDASSLHKVSGATPTNEIKALVGKSLSDHEENYTNELIIITNTKLAESHFNLALLKHEANELEEALSHYSAAVEAKKKSGAGVFVDAVYNLKIVENQIKVAARKARRREQSPDSVLKKNMKSSHKKKKKSKRRGSDSSSNGGRDISRRDQAIAEYESWGKKSRRRQNRGVADVNKVLGNTQNSDHHSNREEDGEEDDSQNRAWNESNEEEEDDVWSLSSWGSKAGSRHTSKNSVNSSRSRSRHKSDKGDDSRSQDGGSELENDDDDGSSSRTSFSESSVSTSSATESSGYSSEESLDSDFADDMDDLSNMDLDDGKLQEMYGSDEEDWYTAALRAKEKEKQRQKYGNDAYYEDEAHNNKDEEEEKDDDDNGLKESLLKSGRKTSELLSQKRDTTVADELVKFATTTQSSSSPSRLSNERNEPTSSRLLNRQKSKIKVTLSSPDEEIGTVVNLNLVQTQQKNFTNPHHHHDNHEGDDEDEVIGSGGIFRQLCGCFMKKTKQKRSIELATSRYDKKLSAKDIRLLERTQKYREEAEAAANQPHGILGDDDDEEEDDDDIGYESEQSYHSSDDYSTDSDSGSETGSEYSEYSENPSEKDQIFEKEVLDLKGPSLEQEKRNINMKEEEEDNRINENRSKKKKEIISTETKDKPQKEVFTFDEWSEEPMEVWEVEEETSNPLKLNNDDANQESYEMWQDEEAEAEEWVEDEPEEWVDEDQDLNGLQKNNLVEESVDQDLTPQLPQVE